MTATEHLQPSQLGSKSYWDDLYALERSNFSSNPADEGTIWFSDSNAEDRILRYLESLNLDAENTTFLDIGTGNGHLLFSLVEENEYNGYKMMGIDYSEDSIVLADRIKEERGGGCENIKFKVVDFVRNAMVGTNSLKEGDAGMVKSEDSKAWDVVLDKGTFDAISLSDETVDGRRLDELYIQKVGDYVKEDTGILLITSCNWTEEELKNKFLASGVLSVCGRIKYSSFTFGGATGQTITSVAFKHKATSS